MSIPVDPQYIPRTEDVKAAYMKSQAPVNVPQKIEYELGFEQWLSAQRDNPFRNYDALLGEVYQRNLRIQELEAEVTQMRKGIELFSSMPINSGGSSREPEVSLDLINWTKALDVAEGRDDPANWVHEPCKNSTGRGVGTFRFEHSPHHWNDYEDGREPLRIAHWCNGTLA
jgi:hypothetical protein